MSIRVVCVFFDFNDNNISEISFLAMVELSNCD